jgi:hypothetical protein
VSAASAAAFPHQVLFGGDHVSHYNLVPLHACITHFYTDIFASSVANLNAEARVTRQIVYTSPNQVIFREPRLSKVWIPGPWSLERRGI